MKTFFVKHGLEQYGRTPGRYPYDVVGSALCRNGASFTRQHFAGRIYGDGYETGPGSNIDPHVLSDVMPWFLSFCLIDKKPDRDVDAKRLVYPNKQQRLPDLVRTGDLVIFGSFVSTHVVSVDTILCVDNVLTIPQSNGRLNIQEYHRCHHQSLQLPHRWQDFIQTRAYGYNLRDAESPDGNHQFTYGLDPYKQIVGTRLDHRQIESVTTDALLQRFLNGQGFNFIPLRSERESENRSVRNRPGLFTMKLPDVDFKSDLDSVTCLSDLDSNPSRKVLSAILQTADTLVLDRIDPVNPLPAPARTGH